MSFLARDDQIVRLRVPASGRSTGRKGWQCTTRYELEGKDRSDQSLEAWFDEQNRQWGQKIGEGADSSPGTENRLERQLSTLRTRLAGLHLSGKEASVRGLGCARPNRPDLRRTIVRSVSLSLARGVEGSRLGGRQMSDDKGPERSGGEGQAAPASVASRGERGKGQSMSFTHIPHPQIAGRKLQGPIKVLDQLPQDTAIDRFNAWLAVKITSTVGTMWCAYAFAALACVSLPAAIASHNPVVVVSWISQTFLQLVLLSVIMVGQNIQGNASDKRAQQTYNDAEAVLQEALQIQQHLTVQDVHLQRQDDRLEEIISGLPKAFPSASDAAVAAPE